MITLKSLTIGLLLPGLLLTTTAQSESAVSDDIIFARVGKSEIKLGEYRDALIRGSRNTFYHGSPPESEILAFQKKVADDIINRELAIQQAELLGMQVNMSDLELELEKYRARALRRGVEIDETSEAWQRLTERIKGDLTAQELESRIRQETPVASEEVLKSYYDENPQIFTEPARFNLSTILLGVAASSGPEAWEAARQEAEDIVRRLRAGADFSELARIHSSDISAEDGGKLGYVHKGMFSAQVHEIIEQLEPGEITDPLQVLEGIVILRLEGKEPANLVDFEKSRIRAEELWLRQARDKHWQDYLAALRENTSIHIEEQYLTISGRNQETTDSPDDN